MDLGACRTRMTEVKPHLWLCSAENVTNAAFLRSRGITHCVNCAEELGRLVYPVPVERWHVPLTDDVDPVAETQILLAAGKVEVWTRAGHTVAVHCRAGISRSPTVIMAWLILYRGYSFDDAWTTIAKTKRFIRPIAHYETILRALATPPQMPQHPPADGTGPQ
jgi:hypothetical protein